VSGVRPRSDPGLALLWHLGVRPRSVVSQFGFWSGVNWSSQDLVDSR
jgi:hypothetical protein